MKVVLAYLFLQAALPGYLAMDLAGTGMPTYGKLGYDDFGGDMSLQGGPQFNSYDYVGGKLGADSLHAQSSETTSTGIPLVRMPNGKYAAAFGTTHDDLKQVDDLELETLFGTDDESDVKVQQADGSFKDVGGTISNKLKDGVNAAEDFFNGNDTPQPTTPLYRRATRTRGDYAALKRRSTTQFANQVALRKREANTQLAIQQQLQKREIPGNLSDTSGTSSSSDNEVPIADDTQETSV